MPDDPDRIIQTSILLGRGWTHSNDGWRHPRIPQLPPLTLAQASELQEQADLDLRQFDPAHGNPAAPDRIH